MDAFIGVALGDGRWALLTEKELAAGLARAAAHPLLVPAAPAPTKPEERMVSSAEAATIVGVAGTTLETMAATGKIRSHRFGTRLRFLMSEVAADTRRKS